MTAALSTALTMSMTVSAATETAVSASISTPVRSVVATEAPISTASSATTRSTVTDDSISGWHSGIERRRLLGAHDAGEAGDGEGVALGHSLPAQQLDDGGRDEHPTRRGRGARGDVLAGHVDHPGGAVTRRRASTGRTPWPSEVAVEQEHLHHVPGADARSPRAATTMSALDAARSPMQVRAVAADRGDAARPRRTRRARTAAARRASGCRGSAAPAPAGGSPGAGPSSGAGRAARTSGRRGTTTRGCPGA